MESTKNKETNKKPTKQKNMETNLKKQTNKKVLSLYTSEAIMHGMKLLAFHFRTNSSKTNGVILRSSQVQFSLKAHLLFSMY